MMDLTKLADELRAAAYKAPDRATSRAMFEAAHIIRSAASLDMTGFMAMHDAAAEARRVLVSGGNVPQAEADRSRLSRAALESALRMALAAREGFVPGCTCATCMPNGNPWNNEPMRMILCAKCGNKRCPHATDHRNACTNSNEPGQPGNAYAAAPKDVQQFLAGREGADSTEQALGLYVTQADAIKELLDEHAPFTTGNLQSRVAQLCLGTKAKSKGTA